MGVGFVLVAWAVLLGGLAICLAAVMFVWLREGGDVGVLQAAKAAALPVVILAWGGTAFIGYAVWCVEVRHVDIGLGDEAQVPIAGGYALCLTDLSGGTQIDREDCSGRGLVNDVTDLAVSDDSVVGKLGSGGGFVLSIKSGQVRQFTDVAEALDQFPQRPALQSADAFYQRQRWGWPDVFFVLAVGIVATGLFYVWGRQYLWSAKIL